MAVATLAKANTGGTPLGIGYGAAMTRSRAHPRDGA
jgi:hypothetical protein